MKITNNGAQKDRTDKDTRQKTDSDDVVCVVCVVEYVCVCVVHLDECVENRVVIVFVQQPNIKQWCWPLKLPQHQPMTPTTTIGWTIVCAGVLGQCHVADLHMCTRYSSRPNRNHPAQGIGRTKHRVPRNAERWPGRLWFSHVIGRRWSINSKNTAW